MQQSDWASAWGTDNLIEFSEEGLSQYLPKTRAFLQTLGMPQDVEIDDITHVTLEPMCHPLEAITEDDWDDLANQLVIGGAEIDGGVSLLCVLDSQRETISFYDPDGDGSLIFVNGDLRMFAQSLLKISQLNQRVAEGKELAAHDIDRLALELRMIDPAALDNERCYWQIHLKYLHERVGPR